MSQIRVIYEAEPKFPATDQHPDALRYRIGRYWVDAVGGEPSAAEVDAILNPPKSADDTALEAARSALEAKAVKTELENAVLALVRSAAR